VSFSAPIAECKHAERVRSAVDDQLSMPIVRFPTGPLMVRAYELRSNVTPYEAAYIALAEGLRCPLVSADARLVGAPGLHCAVELLAQARSL
jgi:predicted nucleic acid-binding protein